MQIRLKTKPYTYAIAHGKMLADAMRSQISELDSFSPLDPRKWRYKIRTKSNALCVVYYTFLIRQRSIFKIE
jgi:hypothetical protein